MRILTIDIETCPHLSFHFGRWKTNIPYQNTIMESQVLCWAAKWKDSDEVEFMSTWDHGFNAMMNGMWELLDEADVVIGFNSDAFDIKRINAEFLRLGWGRPSPYQTIDLFKQAKKHFAFSSNRLKDLLKELDLTPKLEDNADMKLWMDCAFFEDAEAQGRMEDYNIQDVLSTEEFYDYMLGWIEPHPNWGLYVDDVSDPENPVCPNCGGQHMVKHKRRYTKVNAYQQWHCNDCGRYARGRRSLTKLKNTEGLVT